MAADHELILPFPTGAEAAQAVTLLIEVVTNPGAGHTPRCVANAVYAVVGYAGERASEFLQTPAAAERVPLGAGAKADELRKLKAHLEQPVVFQGAVNWLLILDLVYQILRDLLGPQVAA